MNEMKKVVSHNENGLSGFKTSENRPQIVSPQKPGKVMTVIIEK